MAQAELTNAFKYIVKKCDILINNDDYEADAYTQDTVEDIAELCNHILDEDYGKLVEVKDVDLEKEIDDYMAKEWEGVEEDKPLYDMMKNELSDIAKHFYELGMQHDNWKVVDNINPPQADKNKIYCVFTKDRYILATVINHPKDEELLQWKCTEFPFHRYDMCEGDKYMQIV